MSLEDRNTLFVVFEEIRMLTRALLAEYEQLSKDLEQRKKYPFASAAYLQSIVVNLGKIFSKSNNEQFRLRRFKELGYPTVDSKVDALELEYKDLISKVRNNRDKIFAHTDWKYHEMLFSKEHVAKLESIHGAKYPMLLAIDKSVERYTATDLTNDIPQIYQVLDKVLQEVLATESDNKEKHI